MTPIQEVAMRARVSVATVSRVLNNSTGVKQETRIKVLQAMKDLHYRPNLSGRFLRKNETRLILVLLPTISNPFYAKAIKGIQDVADNSGYLIMICNTESNTKKEIEFINLAKNRLADGIIIMSQELDVAEFREIIQDVSVIQCFEYDDHPDISYVSIDNEKAAYDAVEHLVKLGHQRVGLLSVNAHYLSARHRENGYRKALADAHMTIDESLIARGSYRYKSGYENAIQLLTSQCPPTAIFAVSDVLAIGAVKAIKSLGLSVPEDVSVMGFDNIYFSSMYSPSISTVSQPAYQIGEKAMELLIDMMKGEKKLDQHILLDHHLIIRESTACLRQMDIHFASTLAWHRPDDDS